MKAVIDTNVFVSSFFGGNPRKVIDHWFSGRLTLCLSRPILEEYFNVLGRFEFDDDALLLKLMSFIERNENILFVENPEDNKFVACAIALEADYIVSGDSHLTRAKRTGKAEILTPLEILRVLSGKNP